MISGFGEGSRNDDDGNLDLLRRTRRRDGRFLHRGGAYPDILERRHGRVATLLDVACGTGAITAPLSRAYQVSGLDITPGMLAVARAKLPGDVPLYLADDQLHAQHQIPRHRLRISRRQSPVSLSAWESFFGCAHRHLIPAACSCLISPPSSTS